MTKELTQARLKELLHYDAETGVFTWRVTISSRARAGNRAGWSNGSGYRLIRVEGTSHYSHRLAWLYVHGYWPSQVIDHIDGVKDNNAIANLRDVTVQQNNHNLLRARSDNTTGMPGVSWAKRESKLRAYINANGRQIHLGYFTTLEEATAARKAAELLYFPSKPQG